MCFESFDIDRGTQSDRERMTAARDSTKVGWPRHVIPPRKGPTRVAARNSVEPIAL